jgi:hypothetical protein
MADSACSICDQVAGRIAAPGGAIYDDGLWLVSHHTGAQTDLGELIIRFAATTSPWRISPRPRPRRSAPS